MKIVLYENVSISEGDYIEVIGEIDEYKGEREVIGNRVRRIS
jgi:DNA/RNA endonuclease YhcR with UshA esterase domain